MYSKGCKNAQYELLLGSGTKCRQYLGKCECGEAGLVPHALFMSTRGGYLFRNFWLGPRKKQAWTGQ